MIKLGCLNDNHKGMVIVVTRGVSSPFSPSVQLKQSYKLKKISREVYSIKYFLEMQLLLEQSERWFKDLIEQGRSSNVTLVSNEIDGVFSHRYLLFNVLQALEEKWFGDNIACKEE